MVDGVNVAGGVVKKTKAELLEREISRQLGKLRTDFPTARLPRIDVRVVRNEDRSFTITCNSNITSLQQMALDLVCDKYCLCNKVRGRDKDGNYIIDSSPDDRVGDDRVLRSYWQGRRKGGGENAHAE